MYDGVLLWVNLHSIKPEWIAYIVTVCDSCLFLGARLLSRQQAEQLVAQLTIGKTILWTITCDNSSVLQVCPFRVMVSTDRSVTGKGVFSHCRWFWPSPTWFCCFSGTGAEIELGPGCYPHGGKPGKSGYPGMGGGGERGPCFPSFAPCQAPGTFVPSARVTICT